MNDPRLGTKVIDRLIAIRRNELASKLMDTLPETPEMDRRTLPPGYIANAISDIRALNDMRAIAAAREQAERDDAA